MQVFTAYFVYQVGFFRRKKREDENKEAEGDFEPPVAVPAG